MNQQKIGEFIKDKRKEKGLTQAELANKLGITNQAISKWERGKNCPDISLLKDLCKILDININELLSGKELEKVSKEESEDILVETVKTYTDIEKKKNKRLLLFTIVLLVFYIILVIVMYLTYNQINKTDGINWETIQTKNMADKLFIALENYDYDYLRKLEREHNTIIVEDENKCDEYLEMEDHNDWGIVCRLKDFENNGIKFKSHKYNNQFYAGLGNFLVEYKYVATYKDIDTNLSITFSSHNGVFNEFGGVGIDTSNKIYTYAELEEKGYKNIYEKLIYFFQYDEEKSYIKTVDKNN